MEPPGIEKHPPFLFIVLLHFLDKLLHQPFFSGKCPIAVVFKEVMPQAIEKGAGKVPYYFLLMGICTAKYAIHHVVILAYGGKLLFGQLQHGLILHGQECLEVIGQPQPAKKRFGHGDTQTAEIVTHLSLFKNIFGKGYAQASRRQLDREQFHLSFRISLQPDAAHIQVALYRIGCHDFFPVFTNEKIIAYISHFSLLPKERFQFQKKVRLHASNINLTTNIVQKRVSCGLNITISPTLSIKRPFFPTD